MSIASPSTMFWLQIATLGRNLDSASSCARELLLQELHRLEGMIDRLLSDHQGRGATGCSRSVVERLVAGMAFDVLEQQRRRFFAGRQDR